ncbi:hypothetical protein Patl1_26616 [Pistacia atlantica]|uniref:Uncharacterized protein n=1 Tax=Pistacia atlantica TaxID=434234 RepID=A0ACC1AZC3_9ROSI|nr:hypothetical protein Patl1_26616 [Pistacia atlantica]
MAFSPSSLLLPLGSGSGKTLSTCCHGVSCDKVRGVFARCSNMKLGVRASGTRLYGNEMNFIKAEGGYWPGFGSFKPPFGVIPKQLCVLKVPMVTTESGLQYKDIKVGEGPSPPIGFQVAANYVAMVPSGQIFDSSLEKGLPYLFRVGSGQVIKGLDEGILTMKVGGTRRLYIPGQLAFPKGLVSAPGRPRVAPSSPVIFDVNLVYIPGLELDEE